MQYTDRMDEKKQKEANDWRLQARELKQKGWNQLDIAEAVGVSKVGVGEDLHKL
ncbi:MAG: hypothetical protein ABI690_22505 [Chloroflexota bacterium]